MNTPNDKSASVGHPKGDCTRCGKFAETLYYSCKETVCYDCKRILVSKVDARIGAIDKVYNAALKAHWMNKSQRSN